MFELTGTNNTYVGLGFNDSMFFTDMHVVEFLENGNYTATDLYSLKHGMPLPDIAYNGTDDLKNISLTYNSNFQPVITYYRKLNTNDIYDYIFIPNTTCNLVVAWKEGSLRYHGSGNHFSLNFTVSPLPVPEPFDPQKDLDYWDFHGISMTTTWSLLNLIGYISIRFFKHLSNGMMSHIIFSGFSGAYTIVIAGFSIYKSSGATDLEWFHSLHIIMGYVMLSVVVIQMAMGWVNYLCIYKSRKVSNARIYVFKFLHKVNKIFFNFLKF